MSEQTLEYCTSCRKTWMPAKQVANYSCGKCGQPTQKVVVKAKPARIEA